MIKKNQRLFNRIQVLVDAGVIALAYLAAWYLRFESGIFQHAGGALSMQKYFTALVCIVPGYLILYYFSKLYTPRRSRSRRLEVWSIVRANTLGLLLIILTLYVGKQEHFSRKMLFLFWGLNIFLEIAARGIIRYGLRKIRTSGYNQKHILLVGTSKVAEQYLEQIQKNPQWGYHVLGILSEEISEGKEFKKAKILGKISKLQQIIVENDLDEIVITLKMQECDKLERIVDICETAGIHTKFIPDYGNVIPTRPYIEDVQGMPVINIRNVPLKEPVNRWMKRSIDFVGALVGLLLLWPVIGITMLAIRVTTHGPAIFKQERIGLNNHPFNMYKLRSMVVQEEEDEKKEWTTKNDPRVTSVGKVIRRFNIDELPQLVNVLKGEMSLVGPRPERPQFVEKFKNEIPRYMIKHQVCPGMTGWAQVHGYRGDTSIQKRIEYDLYYIENWTLGLDFKIILMTFFKGFER